MPDDYMGLNYAPFGVIAIKAIQEQHVQIETLKKEIEVLEGGGEKITNEHCDDPVTGCQPSTAQLPTDLLYPV